MPSEKTASDRKEYDKARNQRPDRKEYHWRQEAKRRQQAIANGVCTRFRKEPPKEGKIRCRGCADKNNADNRRYSAKPEAMEKQKARAKEFRERKATGIRIDRSEATTPIPPQAPDGNTIQEEINF